MTRRAARSTDTTAAIRTHYARSHDQNPTNREEGNTYVFCFQIMLGSGPSSDVVQVLARGGRS
jgi:hypothetical protein